MRGSHHPCAEFRVCTPAVLIIKGSHHPYTEFPGLYTCCAHYGGVSTIPMLSSRICTPAVLIYEGFPPSLYRVPSSVHLLCP
ncbi:unnamed protein product, partial [Staurois parvus]